MPQPKLAIIGSGTIGERGASSPNLDGPGESERPRVGVVVVGYPIAVVSIEIVGTKNELAVSYAK